MAQAAEYDKTRLTDEEWEWIFAKLQMIDGISTGGSFACRCFVEAALWVLRVGGPWRSLPADQGKWNSAFKRYAQWSKRGIWGPLHEWQAEAVDLQNVSINSTVARAQACAAGAAKSCAEDEARSRSRVGFSGKIHAVVDALGLPLKFILTGGQAARYQASDPPDGRRICPSLLGRQGIGLRRFRGVTQGSRH